MFQQITLTCTLVALGLSIGARSTQAQTISFFREFSNPQMDRASAIAADGTGVYLFGERPASAGSVGSASITKFDSRGNQLWSRPLSTPANGGLTVIGAVSESIGVYALLGVGDFAHFFIRKYGAEGNELWTRELGFAFPGAFAVDATGVYVTGRDFPPNLSYLRKYSTEGAVLWTTQFGSSQALQNPHAVAVDRTGIYLAGIAAGGVGSGSFVRKYDLGGKELWTKEPVPPLVFNTLAAAVPAGFFLVTVGATADVLRKYDSDGNEVWNRARPGAGGVEGIVTDATGVYLAGTTAGLPGHCRAGAVDFYVSKYDAAGIEQWTREFGSSDLAVANGLAVDSSGVYVAGMAGPSGYEDFEIVSRFGGTNRAFLARFEKSNAPVPPPGPRIFRECVVNAASYLGGGVAPGEIVTIFGSSMGPAEIVPLNVTADRKLATTLAATRVLFNGVAAPLLYVSEKQSSAIVPSAVAGRTAVEVQVEYQGAKSEAITVPVLPSRPGIFSLDGSGQGQGAILNEDGSVNSPSNPARRGSIVTLYATGGGETASGVEDGQILGSAIPRTTLPISVFFPRLYEGWAQGEVVYAGGSSGSVAGLLQVNVRVPPDAAAYDQVPFAFIIGSHWTAYQVTISLR